MAFTSGSTPFGIFDADVVFQSDSDRIIPYVLQKFGDPIMHVELTPNQIYMSFEEATLEFSAIINQYQAKSVITSLLGSPTGSLTGGQNLYPNKTFDFQRRQTEHYNELAGVNGSHTLHKGSVDAVVGTQTYDLQHLLSASVNDRIIIKDVFHTSPLSAYRFFGTTSAVNYLNNQFSFESFTPETIFYLLPIWEDVLRGMQFKTSNKIRRSQYSYDINNNVVTLFPTPASNTTLWFTYYIKPNALTPTTSSWAANGTAILDPQMYGVSNLSNVPFGNIQYSKINSVGRQWIWKMTAALCKEVLGQVRGKMQSIPIPNGDLTLNGSELIQDSKAEQETLRSDLKAILEELTYDKLAAKEADMQEALKRAMQEAPLPIYIG